MVMLEKPFPVLHSTNLLVPILESISALPVPTMTALEVLKPNYLRVLYLLIVFDVILFLYGLISPCTTSPH